MSGFSITVNGDAVALTGGTIVGNKVIFTAASAIYPNDTVLGSYDANVGNIQGESSPLASFTSQPATNGSGATPPGATYPLNDDGTLAASFGFGWLETDAPGYVNADYTYTGAPSLEGPLIATPSAARAWTEQAITVGSGKKLAVEWAVNSASYADFGLIGAIILMALDGEFAGIFGTIGIAYDEYDGAVVDGSLANRQPRSAPTTGFRLGIELDGDTGTVTLLWTGGEEVSSTTFTPGQQFVFGSFLIDNGITPAGQTASITLVPSAADMQLTYTAGAVDFNGDVIA